ncbi:BREX system P-loop protein BrxC [Pseudomonadales bacterium]|nr:BREX system P-loop protein BrxC [Pseudomonadales bacterium]
MNIGEMFQKPLSRSINGVVKADQDDDATVFQELDEYIVTNELEKHFRAFFESYATELTDPSIANRVGIWISGFFGSGKSHFLKTLGYILANKEARDANGQPKNAVDFFDETKLRDALIRADVDKAVSRSADVILFNIDSKSSATDGGNAILNVFLRVFNEHLGFSGDHPHIAHMERHLVEKGAYDTFQAAFAASSGDAWVDARDGYQFHQDDVEAALASALGLSADAAHKWFEAAEQTFSVSVEKFCTWVKEYLDTQPKDHRVLFLADEVGQFIGSDTRLMLTLQTITENLGTICKGRAWIIVTSQADMDAVLGEISSAKANDFSKIAGRFKTRLSLSSANADEVIQKRLLRKTEAAEAELNAVYASKGDILKNQISFDRSGPTLKNFDGPASFVVNYPFAPYQFQLVQKVFEDVRKIGATGAHLAYGERSMLDAFQLAALSIAGEPVGRLVPFHEFYAAIEGFLDPAVKKTIDQASQNSVLDAGDAQLLRTLFMIRYVDLVKGTPENLVTLSIDRIDADKLALRKQVEDSLQRLEKESLITRNGDEYVFLTNEERDITRKIKATDIAGTEENKELSSLIYKDLLKDKNKYRYAINGMDYSVGRFLDGHTLDGRLENDLRFDVVSPLDSDYLRYTDAGCASRSGEGLALLKLMDNKPFFDELRTWIKTKKYIRLNDDSNQPELSRILAARGQENLERLKRLRADCEAMLQAADVYALGQKLDLTSSSLPMKYDGACQYLLENTYNKLKYLKVLQKDPYRELSAVLLADDIGQMGLTLNAEEGNPQATKEVEQYISLRTSGNERVLVSDIVDQFSKAPCGWPDGEILLIIGRLAAAGRLSFQLDGGTLPLNSAFEPLQNSRDRRKVSVIRRRQTEEGMLKQARDLTQKLFAAMGPATEKELFDFYKQHFNTWRGLLQGYASKAEVGHFPGKADITQAKLTLDRLLGHDDSFEFFTQVVDNKNDYLDLEEDYRDIHEFFSNQLQTWQQLQLALAKYAVNKQALERDEQATVAMQALDAISTNVRPYGELHKVAALISTVDTIIAAILNDKRAHALERVDEKINQLMTEISKSPVATPELSNALLRPLQRVKADLTTEHSIATIFMLQSQTATERFDDGLAALDAAVHAAAERKQKEAAAEAKAASVTGNQSPHHISEPTPVVAPPRPVVEVNVSAVFAKTNGSVYLESLEDVSAFMQALTDELQADIKAGKRIRLR